MATATIFDVEHFSTVLPDNLDGRVISLFWVAEGGESISGVCFGYLVNVKVKPEDTCQSWQQNNHYFFLIAECDQPA